MGSRAHRFREAVEHESHGEILDSFADDVVFHSPVRFHAYEGREAVSRVFTALLEAIEGYEVVDELESDDRVALAYLANRAVATRLFRELRTASDDPVADLAAGHYEALAALEMDHLALRTKG